MADEPEVPDGKGIKGALGKKIGPLPVGVWILAVGGGLVAAWYLRSRSGGGAAAEDPNDPTRNTDTAPGAGGAGGTGNGTQRPTTNEEWYQLASQMLLGLGTYNALLIDTALKTYLSGSRQLTSAEQAVVAAAIRLIGPPPTPTPVPDPSGGGTTPIPIPTTPVDPVVPTVPDPIGTPGTPIDPRPSSPTAGPNEWWYTSKLGDNLYEIAQYHYGSSAARTYRDKIYARNVAEIEWQARKHGKGDSAQGQWLYSGTRLLMPPRISTSSSSSSSTPYTGVFGTGVGSGGSSGSASGSLPSRGGLVSGSAPKAAAPKKKTPPKTKVIGEGSIAGMIGTDY